jgi:hypothetical protein
MLQIELELVFMKERRSTYFPGLPNKILDELSLRRPVREPAAHRRGAVRGALDRRGADRVVHSPDTILIVTIVALAD